MALRHLSLVSVFVAGSALASVACSSPMPRAGDPNGMLIPFSVRIDSSFLVRLDNDPPNVGTELGMGAPGTTVYLLGGSHAGDDSVFRQKLTWGENQFAVQLAPGHHVVLTVQAVGDRQGWANVGEFTVASPDADQIDLKLGAAGAVVTIR